MSEYKLVPVEPTWEMTNAASENSDVNSFIDINNVYKAMLSASPTTDTINIDRAEYEAIKADAERYRWLKDNGRANSKNAGNAVYPKFGLKAIFSFHYWTDDLDQAIDQARKI